jgi:hypothetical protein
MIIMKRKRAERGNFIDIFNKIDKTLKIRNLFGNQSKANKDI